MKAELKTGRNYITAEFDDSRLLCTLLPNNIKTDLTGEAEVIRSLQNPIGAEKLSEMKLSAKNIVIITSDITRPVPSYKIIPAIIDELEKAGAKDGNITVVFALGSHRGHTEEEKRKLVGDKVYGRITCIDHNPEDCVRMGITPGGTPVDIFRLVAEADFRICVGNIEYHYFAGYSGGVKAVMPGVSTRDAIQCNHRRMVDPEAAAGRLEGNPVREDIEAAGRICRVDYIVNVVLDERKEIIRSFSGDSVKAHREGCRFLDTLYKVKIPEQADIVIVSAGGFPKDINMYQAQKALDNAKHAVKDGGVIIWVASCGEGLGEKCFESWMTGHKKASDMIEHIGRDFRLGGHKAAAIALVLQRAEIFLVSDLKPDFVSSVHLRPFDSVTDALTEAEKITGINSKIIVMPYGGSTLPVVLDN